MLFIDVDIFSPCFDMESPWIQFEGVKGNSTSHYLIDPINLILYNQDLTNPHAIIAIM